MRKIYRRVTERKLDRAFANEFGRLKLYGDDLIIREALHRVRNDIERFRKEK